MEYPLLSDCWIEVSKIFQKSLFERAGSRGIRDVDAGEHLAGFSMAGVFTPTKHVYQVKKNENY